MSLGAWLELIASGVITGGIYALVALVDGITSGARAAGADCVVSVPFDPTTLADELLAAVGERL